VIYQIYKNRGDLVKETDNTVMVLHSLDHLLAEAPIDAQYLDRIKPKMTATLEPTQEHAPQATRSVHRGEVTAVAVTNDADPPRLVSAGRDHIVSVRDPFGGALPVILRHDAPVRALACSPPGAEHCLAITGAGDKIFFWNLERDALAAAAPRVKPARESI